VQRTTGYPKSGVISYGDATACDNGSSSTYSVYTLSDLLHFGYAYRGVCIQVKLQLGLARGERIAQCEHVKLITDRSLPVQIDGGK